MANPERWTRFEDLPDDLAERLDRLPAFFEERGVLLAYLFGSFADGERDRAETEASHGEAEADPEKAKTGCGKAEASCGETEAGCGETEAGRAPPGDVDLAVLTEGEPAYTLRPSLHEALGTERLDLVDLRRASPLLRFHIVRHGRLLYARSDEALNRFELDTLHLYRDTAPLRRRQRERLRERMDAWS